MSRPQWLSYILFMVLGCLLYVPASQSSREHRWIHPGLQAGGATGLGCTPSACRPGYSLESHLYLSKSLVTWPVLALGLSAHLLLAFSTEGLHWPVQSTQVALAWTTPTVPIGGVRGGLLTSLAPLSLLGAGPAWGGRSDLAGKEGRLCFQGWLSRPALENILSQLGALCCVVCFHGVWGEW